MITVERVDGGWMAHAEIVIGTERRAIDVELGAIAPPDPIGLRSVPVVTVDRQREPFVAAGIRRAGDDPLLVVIEPEAVPIGGRLLRAVDDGAEVVVALDGGVNALRAARALGGRPIPSLDLSDTRGLRVAVDAIDIDVNLAIPRLEVRDAEIREVVTPLALERRHHPVEVDPRPAFDELGRSVDGAPLGALAAAATGVLAGRLAAANRRWRL
jgi:hypothetical protein